MKAPKRLFRWRVYPDQVTYSEINKGGTGWVVKGIYVPEGSERRAVVRGLERWLENSPSVIDTKTLFVFRSELRRKLREIGRA